MPGNPEPAARRRSYTQTHSEMIEAAIRLISQEGVASLSIAAVARESGVDRTTIYYHFKDRDALVEEFKAWA